jgi:hypothetical protein
MFTLSFINIPILLLSFFLRWKFPFLIDASISLIIILNVIGFASGFINYIIINDKKRYYLLALSICNINAILLHFDIYNKMKQMINSNIIISDIIVYSLVIFLITSAVVIKIYIVLCNRHKKYGKIKIFTLVFSIMYFQLCGCNTSYRDSLSFSYVPHSDLRMKSMPDQEECLKQSITNAIETVKIIINRALESNTNNAALRLLMRHLPDNKLDPTIFFVCIFTNTIKGVVVITPHYKLLNAPFEYYSYIIQIVNNKSNTIFISDYRGNYRSSSSHEIEKDIDYFLADTNIPHKIGIDANYYAKNGTLHFFVFFSMDNRLPVVKRILVINNLSGMFTRMKLGKILNFKYNLIFKNEKDYCTFKDKGLVYSNIITQYPGILKHIKNLYYEKVEY